MRELTIRIKQFIKEHYLISCVIIGSVLIRCYEITERWVGIHELNGALWSTWARNLIRFGYLSTKFALIKFVHPIIPSGENYFTFSVHHPVLGPVILSIFFRIFGIHEWSARLMPIFFSFTTIIVLYLIVRKIFDNKIAILSAIFLAFIPMDAYFGRQVNFEQPTLFFSLLVFYFYLFWIESYHRKFYIGMVVGIILAGLSDWGGYFITPAIVLHYLFYSKSKKQVTSKYLHIFLLPMINVALFIGHFLHQGLILGSTTVMINEMIDRFAMRGSLTDDYSGPLGLGIQDLIRKEAWVVFIYHTPILAIISIGWLFSFVNNIINRDYHRDLLVVAIFLPGVLNFLCFLKGSFMHEYYLYYLSPGIAIASAVGLEYIIEKIVLPMKTFKTAVRIAFLVVFITFSLYAVKKLHINLPGYEYQVEFGELVNKNFQPHECVLTNQRFSGQILYYSDRDIMWEDIFREGINSIQLLNKALTDTTTRQINRFIFSDYMMKHQPWWYNRNTSLEAELREYLFDNYPSRKISNDYGIYMFDLTKPKNLSLSEG